MSRWDRVFSALLLLVLLPGCSGQNDDPYYSPVEIKFRDDVHGQSPPTVPFTSVPLSLKSGESSTLADLASGKILVAVFTRGLSGPICPYCSTQTAGLISNYAEFQKRNAEVVVIYPLKDTGDAPRRSAFVQRVNLLNQSPPEKEPPFPLVLDCGLQAVDLLGIRKDLSKPATYIIDPQGNVRFAYVGESLADRPSVKALLAQIDQIETTASPQTNTSPQAPSNVPPQSASPSSTSNP